ncbi:hypothetical protein H3N56_11620 [Cetobacterium sp. 2A]|uniref:hypothetical protein n=1 Tax=Cetobacterium sp. 2A TaxID=2754723 RepID=UPI00163CCC46|nr:hypothetical protein [Cetobacterium sp. 2A]MBC2857081.1 hypothetical protein [Cetobacterium sp. 2A]
MGEILIITIIIFFIILCYLCYVYDSFYSEPMTKEKLESIKETKEILSKKDLLMLGGVYKNIFLLKSKGFVTILEGEVKKKDRSFRGNYGIKYTYSFDYVNDWKINIFNTYFINKDKFFLKENEVTTLKGVVALGSFYVIEINGFNILDYVKEIESFPSERDKLDPIFSNLILSFILLFVAFFNPFSKLTTIFTLCVVGCAIIFNLKGIIFSKLYKIDNKLCKVEYFPTFSIDDIITNGKLTTIFARNRCIEISILLTLVVCLIFSFKSFRIYSDGLHRDTRKEIVTERSKEYSFSDFEIGDKLILQNIQAMLDESTGIIYILRKENSREDNKIMTLLKGLPLYPLRNESVIQIADIYNFYEKEIEFLTEDREIRKNDFMFKIDLTPENTRRYYSLSNGDISYDLLKRNSKQILKFINGTEFNTTGIITKKNKMTEVITLDVSKKDFGEKEFENLRVIFKLYILITLLYLYLFFAYLYKYWFIKNKLEITEDI